MRRILLTTAAAIAVAGAAWIIMPDVVRGAADLAGEAVCRIAPDHCFSVRRSNLRAEQEHLRDHMRRVQEGLQMLDEHAGQLRMRLDAIEVNAQQLALREIGRRASGSATLELAGRAYTASDVEEQARLWSMEAAQFRAQLEGPVKARRTVFVAQREKIALTLGNIDGLLQIMMADDVTGLVSRDLDRMKTLNAAAASTMQVARQVTTSDPVRSIAELGQPATPATPAGRPMFSMDDWLRKQTVPRG